MDLGLNGRHVIVTGGAGALGAAVVGLLLEEGATCAVPCRTPEELERFPFRADGRVTTVGEVDLADERAAESFYERATGGGGKTLWASVHIAGGFAMAPVEKTSAAMFDAQVRMNATTCFLCCREAAKRMKTGGSGGGGGGGGGRIVNVAARPALAPELGAGMVAYTASKAAVAAMTRALAAELAPEGIWVNAVVPSILDTPANRAAMPDADHAAWPGVEEVARTIVFLASPANATTRGGLVPVYGRS